VLQKGIFDRSPFRQNIIHFLTSSFRENRVGVSRFNCFAIFVFCLSTFKSPYAFSKDVHAIKKGTAAQRQSVLTVSSQSKTSFKKAGALVTQALASDGIAQLIPGPDWKDQKNRQTKILLSPELILVVDNPLKSGSQKNDEGSGVARLVDRVDGGELARIDLAQDGAVSSFLKSSGKVGRLNALLSDAKQSQWSKNLAEKFELKLEDASCPKINLFESDPTLVNKLPISGQAGQGNCFAYSTAFMMNNELQPVVVDPVDLTLLYGKEKLNGFEGGTISDLNLRVQTIGICDQQKFRAFLDKAREQFGINKNLPNWVELTVDRLAELLAKTTAELKSSWVSRFREATAIAELKNECASRGGMDPEFAKELDALRGKTIKDALSDLTKGCAGDRTPVKLPLALEFSSTSNATLQEGIREGLASTKPVYVAYCRNHLVRPGYNGIKKTTGLSRGPDDLKDDCDFHASVIVGQDFIEGECRYLVVEPGYSSFPLTGEFSVGKGQSARKVGFTANRESFLSNTASGFYYPKKNP